MTRNRFAVLLTATAALLISTPAFAQQGASDTELAVALRGGGHVIVFRHGATFADQADTDPLNPTTSPSSAS